MSEVAKLVTCTCEYCGEKSGFPCSDIGTKKDCPQCARAIRLFTDEAPQLWESKCGLDGICIRVILSPGKVRYIRTREFFYSNVEELIAQINQLSSAPVFCFPSYQCDLITKQGEKIPIGSPEFLTLLREESWEVQLRLLHTSGQMVINEGLRLTVYWLFHSYLRLGKHFEFAECLKSWVKGTESNLDLMESYKGSSEHQIIRVKDFGGECGGYHCDCRCGACIFKKTEFVRAKLLAIAQEAEEKKPIVELESLAKSRFTSYVYIMEDLRNKSLKIGHSKTPTKRERTLQSEAPEMILRFAIPADEDEERKLHKRFEAKRQRGEWFSLTADELLWIVSYLKSRGDPSRVIVDYEWLGKVSFMATAKNDEGRKKDQPELL